MIFLDGGMIFIEALNNYMKGIEPLKHELAMEAIFREKLPTALNFIFGEPVPFSLHDVHKRRNEHGCILNIIYHSFELTSIHTHGKECFTCDIEFKVRLNSNSIPVKNATCRFDNDFNLTDFFYTMNMGSFLTKNSIYIENTKYFDGRHEKKMYFKHLDTGVINPIDIVNPELHKENRQFEIFFSNILLTHCTNLDFYQSAFSYLPPINFYDSTIMSLFINELNARYVRKDELLYQSIDLLDMYNV